METRTTGQHILRSGKGTMSRVLATRGLSDTVSGSGSRSRSRSASKGGQQNRNATPSPTGSGTHVRKSSRTLEVSKLAEEQVSAVQLYKLYVVWLCLTLSYLVE